MTSATADFVLVVLSQDRRLLRHIAVTTKPSAGWTAKQIIEAFPQGYRPRFLVRHRDKLFDGRVETARRAMAIKARLTAPRQPWQNGKC